MFFFLQTYSDDIFKCAEKVLKQYNGSDISGSPFTVTIIAPMWGSLFPDAILFSRELAIHLAKFPQVKVGFLVPECSCSESDKRDAAMYSVTIVEAKKRLGFDDPVDCLLFPPEDITTDIVVGVGERSGKIAQILKHFYQCKNIYIALDSLDEYACQLEVKTNWGKEKLHTQRDQNVARSQMADLFVAAGPKMHDKLSASLRYHKKVVFKVTPGILREFSDVGHAFNEQTRFRILIRGGENPDNFEQEGLKTAAEAVATLADKSYHLLCVCAATGHYERLVEKFCQCGVSRSQLTIRSPPKREEELKSLLCAVDLAVMPSSEGEFGMMALTAFSSGLPVLVHEYSGFGEALREVRFGASSTVDSDNAYVWAKAIKRVRITDRRIRLEEASILRSEYDKKYSWEKQCGALVRTMLTMVSGMTFFDALNLVRSYKFQSITCIYLTCSNFVHVKVVSFELK